MLFLNLFLVILYANRIIMKSDACLYLHEDGSVVTWPKNFVFGQVLFSSACMCLCVCLCVCVCVCVCLCVSLLVDYLKKLLTDFDEIWQDGV